MTEMKFRRKRQGPSSPHYVNNKALYEVLKDWKERKAAAIAEGREPPRVPESVGRDIILIAKRLATHPDYSGYPFVEDMVFDAVENCIKYIDNFDPNKSTNPFAYFTQIIIYAFWRKKDREKKQLYIKYKVMATNVDSTEHYDDTWDSQSLSGSGDFLSSDQTKGHMSTFIESYEKTLKTRSERGRRRTVKDGEDE